MAITALPASDDAVEEPPVVPPERLLHTTESAAQILGIGRTTIYALIKEGVLRPVYIGRSCRLSQAELVRYVTALDAVSDHNAPSASPRSVRPYRRPAPHAPVRHPA
jgi:excisionase family DNA binding protein